MTFLELAFLVASMLGAPDAGDTRAIAGAAALACGNESCLVDALVYAKYESGFRVNPRPWSSDARAGRSCGPWQVPCWLKGLDEQARTWVALRTHSIEQCGTLAMLASGSCGKGTRLAEARATEAFWIRFSLHRDELP